MLVSMMKGSILESQLMTVFPLIVLAISVKILVPVMMKAEKAWVRFVIGAGLFGIYTAGVLLMIRHMVFGAASIEDCVTRAGVAVVVMNLMVLFVAALYFFTREKRPMTQEEKMKLKDL